MEMVKGVICCLFTLLLTLTSVSGIQRLDHMRNLKKMISDKSVPEHSLVLLYWFAHTIVIVSNDHILLTFNPANEDYGSHRYYNLENLLGRLHRGQQYYTIGNIRHRTLTPLPSYVLNPPADIEAGNMDRIIIRVRGTVIEEVYLTQHSEDLGASYDPDYTYQVTTNLLRQIQEFPLEDDYQTLVSLRGRYRSNADVSHISDSLGELACLGLFLCIVLNKPNLFKKQTTRPKNRSHRESTENRNNRELTDKRKNPESTENRSNRDTTVVWLEPVSSSAEPNNDDCCTTRCKCILAAVFIALILFTALVIYLIVKIKKES